MRKFLVVAGSILAFTATAASAQDPRRDDGRRPDARRAPVVVQQRPVIVQQRPVVVQRQRPVIAYAPPPPPPAWSRGTHPYAQQHHASCHQKAWRLRWFERRSAADGVLTYREQSEIRGLRRDLRRTCGGWSWRG